MKIKRYDEFNKTNESVVGISIVTAIILIIRLLRISAVYRTTLFKGKRDQALEEEVKSICGSTSEIYSISKGSDKKLPIAAAAGNKIYYDIKLKEILSHRELIAIILHERSHVKSKDIIVTQILKVFPYIPVIWLSSWLLFFLAPFVAGILFIKPIERQQELKSDSYAKKYGYGKEMMSALIKLTEEYDLLGKINEDKKKVDSLITKLIPFMASHPNLYKRLKNLFDKNTPEDFIKKVEVFKGKY